MAFQPPPDDVVREVLRSAKTIAVIGLSPAQWRPAYEISAYMQAQGYRIVPVHPGAREVLGEKAYATLADVPFPVDIVNVFRRSEFVAGHTDEAIQKKAKCLWLQLGVVDEAAANKAAKAGLVVVMNRCLMIDHRRLLG